MSSPGLTMTAPSGAPCAGGAAVVGAGCVVVGFGWVVGVGLVSGGGCACVEAGVDDDEVALGAPIPRKHGSASSRASGLVASRLGEHVVGSLEPAADEARLAWAGA